MDASGVISADGCSHDWRRFWPPAPTVAARAEWDQHRYSVAPHWECSRCGEIGFRGRRGNIFPYAADVQATLREHRREVLDRFSV